MYKKIATVVTHIQGYHA